MKRILTLALAATAMLAIVSAVAATRPAKAPAGAHPDAEQCTKASACCLARQEGTAASSETKSSMECPLDPSQCPSWCREATGAASAATKRAPVRVIPAENPVVAASVVSR